MRTTTLLDSTMESTLHWTRDWLWTYEWSLVLENAYGWLHYPWTIQLSSYITLDPLLYSWESSIRSSQTELNQLNLLWSELNAPSSSLQLIAMRLNTAISSIETLILRLLLHLHHTYQECLSSLVSTIEMTWTYLQVVDW